MLVVTGAVLGWRAVRDTRQELWALSVCERAAERDFSAALLASEGGVFEGESGRLAAECRCRALIATDRSTDCVELLTRAVRVADDSWAPAPDLAELLVRALHEAGRDAEAAPVIKLAVERNPDHPELVLLELNVRSALEDELVVMRELEGRLSGQPALGEQLRCVLASRYARRGQHERGLQVLGDIPSKANAGVINDYMKTRVRLEAELGRLDVAERTCRTWIEAGTQEAFEVEAFCALVLSQAGLLRGQAAIEALRRGTEHYDKLPKPLAEALFVRLISHLIVEHSYDQAHATHGQALRAGFDVSSISSEAIVRAAANDSSADPNAAAARGHIHFKFSRETTGTLEISPAPDQPVWATYERFELRGSRERVIERPPQVLPERWIVRTSSGVRASGAAFVPPGGTAELGVELGPAVEARTLSAGGRRAGDGRRRVQLIVLDCGDWRLVQYLRARGELPYFDRLFEESYRAIVDSYPAFTAAALDTLVRPNARSQAGILSLVRDLGVELAGLSSVGTNPFGVIDAFLPKADQLMDRLGQGELRVANMLFSHGKIQVGRHGQVVGPRGRVEAVSVGRVSRPLTLEERARFPSLLEAKNPSLARNVEEIAAELDAAIEIANEANIDLLLLRIEPLDLITHASYGQSSKHGQDNGATFLFEAYRYIDARLWDLERSLDDDDVLVVVSDHGIRTAMEHDRQALFFAMGKGIRKGQHPGVPEWRGISRFLARLFHVETDWPETGLSEALLDLDPNSPIP
ncbi:MAG: alkaline phosphatase family protein [Deltaproteobacteria bacterium]|nr:alkaline phosphatase family protein [Deltaproteobacteria bacterium]